MNFNSIEYGLFLPIVFLIYWLIPHKWRIFLLFVSSYFFYMCWNVKYILIIFATTIISYFCALIIKRSINGLWRKMAMAVCLISCLGALFFFKYFQFAQDTLSGLLGLFSVHIHSVSLKVLLPVGISFYTFQTLSYVIDIYRGNIDPEYSFLTYATYVSFFPQLVAGPIERPQNLLPQIKCEKQFDYQKAVYGMMQMAWGFYKKMVVADNCAPFVDQIYSNVHICTSFDLLLGVFLFTIQIYCDFSGYSDIAIGTAKLFGIDLMKNFDSPYFSISIRDFWKRWHISLSSWFKDYVYIPLGGNRCSKVRKCFNLLVTFLVSGLWHGANWTFIVWGGLHGVAQIFETIMRNPLELVKRKKWGRFLCGCIVFVFCSFAWVFFRAESINDAIYVLAHSLSGIEKPMTYLVTHIGIKTSEIVTIAFCVAILGVHDYLSINTDIFNWIGKRKPLFRYIYYFVILILILLFRSSGRAEFVYFQF